MASKVTPIPEGYHTLTPHLIVQGASKLLDFLKEAFGATEKYRLPGPDGVVMHAEVKIGDSMVMIGEATGQWQAMPASMALYTDNADALYKRALEAGATDIAISPRHLQHLFALADRHAALVADDRCQSDEAQSMSEWARSRLPWQPEHA